MSNYNYIERPRPVATNVLKGLLLDLLSGSFGLLWPLFESGCGGRQSLIKCPSLILELKTERLDGINATAEASNLCVYLQNIKHGRMSIFLDKTIQYQYADNSHHAYNGFHK